MVDRILKVAKGDVAAACNSLFKNILESGDVDALLVPQITPGGSMVHDVLVSDPDRLDTDVFAPVLPVSTAATVSKLTKVQGAEKTIGVVMRPCQIRALIELTKLKQADLENIMIIGVDCLGTFPINTYTDFSEKEDPTEYILRVHRKKGGGVERYLRTACDVCTDPIPSNADIVIGAFGADTKKELIIQTLSETGERLLAKMGLLVIKDSKTREKALKDVRELKSDRRKMHIERTAGIKGIEALCKLFENCVNCHNCMKACPICYCKECLFDSSVLDMEADRYLQKAKNRGLYKLPDDSVLFHVTRMNHMILSCVGCGLCEQACPNGVLLMDVLPSVADAAQKVIEYSPGKNVEEAVPMAVYREDEYSEVGDE